ncbi:MAG: cytidylate kinase family protein [Candidatus Abawacabacteria bacterium]|nr:cytidylate kinase family protein [Candidatus Abawacabacteria bacterium]
MLITISGESCTGTTTLARSLSKELSLACFLAGELFRELAQEHNISLESLISSKWHDFHTDTLLDQKIIQLFDQQNVIVEGRLSGYLAFSHHIPSKRILLVANSESKAYRLQTREGGTFAEALVSVTARDQKDWARYQTLYGISKSIEKDWYSLIIDNSKLTAEETLHRALAHIHSS